MDKKECKQEAGKFQPVINRNSCEGKAACVDVCPYDVFVIDTLAKEERRNLSFFAKLKGFGHKWQQAFTPNSDQCQACGLCVEACPEKAIKLSRVSKH